MPKATSTAPSTSRYGPASTLSRDARRDHLKKGKLEQRRPAPAKPARRPFVPPPDETRYLYFRENKDWDVAKLSALNEAPRKPTKVHFDRDFSITE